MSIYIYIYILEALDVSRIRVCTGMPSPCSVSSSPVEHR